METHLEILESGFFSKKWVRRFCRLDPASKRIDIFEDGTLNKDVGTVYLRRADTVITGIDDYLLQEGLDGGNFYCCKIMDNECRKEWFFNFDSKSVMDQWTKAIKKCSGSSTSSKGAKDTGSGFSFTALVKSWKKNDEGKHMVYGLHCEMSKVSKSEGKRQRKRWIIWKRFSEFRTLDAKLRKTLGYQIQDIDFPSSSIFTFDKEDVQFLNKRQEGLNIYISAILGIDKVAVFTNKVHCNADLREFVEYDIHSKKKKEKKEKDVVDKDGSKDDAPEPRRKSKLSKEEKAEKKKKNRRATYTAAGAGRSRKEKKNSTDGTPPPPPPPPPPPQATSNGSSGVPPPPPSQSVSFEAPSPAPAPAPAPMPKRPNPFGAAPGGKPNDLLASIRGGAALKKTDTSEPARRASTGTSSSSSAPPTMASQMGAALAARRMAVEDNSDKDNDSDGGDWSDSD